MNNCSWQIPDRLLQSEIMEELQPPQSETQESFSPSVVHYDAGAVVADFYPNIQLEHRGFSSFPQEEASPNRLLQEDQRLDIFKSSLRKEYDDSMLDALIAFGRKSVEGEDSWKELRKPVKDIIDTYISEATTQGQSQEAVEKTIPLRLPTSVVTQILHIREAMLASRKAAVEAIVTPYLTDLKQQGLLPQEPTKGELDNAFRNMPEDLRSAIRTVSEQHIPQELREDYIRHMVATKKYALRGGENGQIHYRYDQDTQKMVAEIITGDRPFHGYRLFSNPNLSDRELDFGNVTGTAFSIKTSDGKRLVVIRSAKNSKYRLDPGAPIAGLFDVQVDRDAHTGIKPISNDTVMENVYAEAEHELGLKRADFASTRLTGLAFDKIAVHSEIIGEARVNLTSEALTEMILENAKKGGTRNEFSEGSFFFIDDSSEALERLLTNVASPLPPTHNATFLGEAFATKYDELLASDVGNEQREERAYREAKIWIDSLQEANKANYRRIDAIVSRFWEGTTDGENNWVRYCRIEAQANTNNPRYHSRDPLSPPSGYDPSITLKEQGLEDVRTALVREGLIAAETEAQVQEEEG